MGSRKPVVESVCCQSAVLDVALSGIMKWDSFIPIKVMREWLSGSPLSSDGKEQDLVNPIFPF